MAEEEWGDRENLSGGKYLRFNKTTKRWYLYNNRNVLITSNRNKQKLMDWRESE